MINFNHKIRIYKINLILIKILLMIYKLNYKNMKSIMINFSMKINFIKNNKNLYKLKSIN